MKGLSDFVKDEFIKKQLFEEGLYINSFDEVNTVVNNINNGEYKNIIFENTYLKERFLSRLKMLRPDYNLINCNSSTNRFFENDFNGLIVFDNIKKCKDKEILEEIKKYKAVLIC
jgi:hypothetical protein